MTIPGKALTDQTRATRQAYRAKHREKLLTQTRDWRAKNKERVRAQAKTNRLKNPEKIKARHRAYYYGNHEKVLASNRRYNLKKHGLGPVSYDALLASQNGVCAICEKPPNQGRTLAIDHDHSCCPKDRSCERCVRGLLCRQCNAWLGRVGERVELAVAYTRNSKNQSVMMPCCKKTWNLRGEADAKLASISEYGTDWLRDKIRALDVPEGEKPKCSDEPPTITIRRMLARGEE